MSGFFGCISKNDCVSPVFYGTDYHSHLGTKRAGLAFFNREDGFQRAIHSLEDGYFRTKFEGDIEKFKGNSGIGVISDTEAQPIVANSHLGKFAICTVSKIVNAEELEEEMLQNHHTFSETSQGSVNPTELVSKLIADGKDFVEGIENVYNKIKGSCSMLILAEVVGTVPEKFERLNRKVAFISADAGTERLIRTEITDIRMMFLAFFILFYVTKFVLKWQERTCYLIFFRPSSYNKKSVRK